MLASNGVYLLLVFIFLGGDGGASAGAGDGDDGDDGDDDGTGESPAPSRQPHAPPRAKRPSLGQTLGGTGEREEDASGGGRRDTRGGVITSRTFQFVATAS